MTKVFGIGWAKTGTTTLGKCLRLLGYDHQTQRLDLVQYLQTGDLNPIYDIAASKDSFDDWPWLLLYKEMDERFPGSKFILTQRDPDSWLKSYRNMLASREEATEELNEIRRTLYSLPFPNVTDDQLLERYRAHNQLVVEYFRDRPESLLIVDWAAGDEWTKLCRFLGKDTPREPFPHANKGNYTRNPSSILRRILNEFIS